MSPQKLGSPQDEQTIRSLATEFVSAWNKNDSKQMAACFSTDGDLINPSGRIARGRTEVERLMQEEHAGPFKGTRLNTQHKHLRFLKPDVAIADYEFEISQMRGGDGKNTLKGHVTFVLHKENDRWLIAAGRPMVPSALPGTSR